MMTPGSTHNSDTALIVPAHGKAFLLGFNVRHRPPGRHRMCCLSDSDCMMSTLNRRGSLPNRCTGLKAAFGPDAAVDSPRFALQL